MSRRTDLVWTQAAKLITWVVDGIEFSETTLYTGDILYTKDGVLHRIHGPAIIHPSQYESNEYWVNGCQYPKHAFDFLFGPYANARIE